MYNASRGSRGSDILLSMPRVKDSRKRGLAERYRRSGRELGRLLVYAQSMQRSRRYIGQWFIDLSREVVQCRSQQRSTTGRHYMKTSSSKTVLDATINAARSVKQSCLHIILLDRICRMIMTKRRETEIIHMQGNAMLPSSSNLFQSHWYPIFVGLQRESRSDSSGRRVVANRSVLSNSHLGLLERSLVVVLRLSVKETERHLLVLVSAFRRTLSSDTRSSVRDGVSERVVVGDSAVDGVRVFATGESEVGVVELGDGHDVHETV
jgi:hypothetical protein